MRDAQQGKIIIIGCRGFIGGTTYAYLRGKYGSRVKGVSSAEIDLRQPASVQQFSRLFDKRARVVVVSGITPEQDNTLRAFDANLKMVNHLAQALLKYPVRQCIYLSTVSVYGRKPKQKPIDERTPIQPDSLYRIAKFVGEELLGQATKLVGTQYLVLRLPRVYGPSDQHSIYGPSAFVRAIKDGQPVRLFGDGKERRAFLYVEDLARIVGEFVGNNAGGVVNVAPLRSESFVAIVVAIEKAMNRKVRVVHVLRSGMKYDEVYNTRRLRTLLPRFIFTPLQQGVQKTCEGLLK